MIIAHSIWKMLKLVHYNFVNYQLCLEAGSAVFDEFLFLKKESYPHEILPNGSSFVFPCQRAIDEYEIVNLGSDARNFDDNTESITLTGFYQ